jgi:protein-L-isoaspartate(D-aspartate) O-methyltransferase
MADRTRSDGSAAPEGGNGGDDRGAARATERRRLAEQVEAEVRATAGELGFARLSPAVRAALERVPRHRFVPERAAAEAYANRPLPIGHGQTISQPYIVAITTELAAPGPDSRVLEIGTGCGYQAAMLAELAGTVITVEAVGELAETARRRLAELGYGNVRVIAGNGARGLPEEAPFDAIVVTAAAPEAVRDRLAAQLGPGGRLVIPVDRAGPAGLIPFAGAQELCLVERDAEGRLAARSVLPVAFVPLVGAEEP